MPRPCLPSHPKCIVLCAATVAQTNAETANHMSILIIALDCDVISITQCQQIHRLLDV